MKRHTMCTNNHIQHGKHIQLNRRLVTSRLGSCFTSMGVYVLLFITVCATTASTPLYCTVWWCCSSGPAFQMTALEAWLRLSATAGTLIRNNGTYCNWICICYALTHSYRCTINRPSFDAVRERLGVVKEPDLPRSPGHVGGQNF